ncbi:MAG: FIST N-terminal domain-containing protein [Myxococcaceae bacterium]|nr:FIST N-terminal domain-containing protein [Myxococcaceae bacterium]
MSTTTGSGKSQLPDTAQAVRAAYQAAMERLEGPADVGLVFAPPVHPFETVQRAMQACSPSTRWLACQSGGGFDERGFARDALVIFLVRSTRARFHDAIAADVRADPSAAAATLCAGFSDQAKAARDAGLPLSTTLALVDGLAGVGEPLVKELRARTRTFQQIVGGASADDGAFKETPVANAERVEPRGAVVVHAFDRIGWGIGVDHGLVPATPRLTATKTRGTTIVELNGAPAFEAYRRFAASKGVTLEPGSAQRFLIAHELGVYFLNQLAHVRAPIFVGPNGELEMIAQVAEGSEVCILEAEPDRLLGAATIAANEAKKSLGAHPVSGVLVFDCICRRMLLGRRFPDEVEAIRGVFPGVPLAGFVTYGEVARFSGRLDGWHNATTVVVAIPA